MKIIRTAVDLEGLRTLDSLPPEYQAYVNTLFGQLEEALGDGEPSFSLDQRGFIVLLETEDDPRHLGNGSSFGTWGSDTLKYSANS